MSETEKKRGGRPRKYIEGVPRPTLLFRIRDPLHKALVASSIRNQRSLSEELESIVEAHFLAGDLREVIRQELCAALYPDKQPEPSINQSAPPH